MTFGKGLGYRFESLRRRGDAIVGSGMQSPKARRALGRAVHEILEGRRMLSGYPIVTLASFNGINAYPSYGVIADSAGNLYGTAGETNSDGVIFEWKKSHRHCHDTRRV